MLVKVITKIIFISYTFNFRCVANRTSYTSLIFFLFLFFMTMGVRVSLGAHHLIPWDFEVYIRVLTSVALRGLEMVIIGEQNSMPDY